MHTWITLIIFFLYNILQSIPALKHFSAFSHLKSGNKFSMVTKTYGKFTIKDMLLHTKPTVW